GPLGQVLGMIPGVKVNDADAQRGEKEIKMMEAIICSMTRTERERPSVIDPKRKRRIATGSGTRVEDVNRILRQFEQMQKMMKQMNSKKGRGQFGKMGFPM
ncbi:MAG: signal recognition particle protein, partial [Oscillospiraceae bacterium]